MRLRLMEIAFVALLILVLTTPIAVAAHSPPAQINGLLEQVTFGQLVVWLLTGGGIAVVIQRLVPQWAAWDSPIKGWIILLLNLAGPYLLAAIRASPIIQGIWEQTLANLVFGVFMAAAAFIVHKVDQWLTATAAVAKARAQVSTAMRL